MKKFIKALFKKQPRIIIGAILIAAGLIIAIIPGTTVTTICIALGVAALSKGVSSLVKAKNTSKFKDIASSVIFITAAIFLFIHPRFLLSIIPFIMGLCLLIFGVIALATSGFTAIGIVPSVVIIIMGLLVTISPFALVKAVTVIIGVTIAVLGILIILSKKYVKFENPFEPKDGYQEVDFTDVDD